jgi:hypothetical protein
MGIMRGGRPAWPRWWSAGLARTRPRWWSAGLAWALWTLGMLGLAAVAWLDRLLRQAGRPDLGLDAISAGEALAIVSALTVGLVLTARRPRHPVGWLLLAFGLSGVAAGVSTVYSGYGLLARPGSLPGAAWVAAYEQHAGIPTGACLGLILLLTPTGAPPSPRWRWWLRLTVAAPLVAMACWLPQPFVEPYRSVPNPLAVPGLAEALLGPAQVALAVTVLAIPVGAWSLVVRFRRAGGTERQQLRWLALAAAVVAVGVVAIVGLLVAGVEAPVGWIFAACLAVLPLATGAAILRYRLYDLDRIISRTLAYGLLTLLLGGGYAVVVLGLGQLLGRDSSLVVAAATLAVAAVIQPARRRIQRGRRPHRAPLNPPVRLAGDRLDREPEAPEHRPPDVTPDGWRERRADQWTSAWLSSPAPTGWRRPRWAVRSKSVASSRCSTPSTPTSPWRAGDPMADRSGPTPRPTTRSLPCPRWPR